jgi:roadblock/LC7 domain-containing protein
MMNVYILLDRSGSMESMWDEALGSINGYVAELPEKTNVFLAVFDTDYNVIRNTTAKKWTTISREDATPRGGTRLFDSAARIMYRALDDNAEKTVIVVMTDGFENSSLNFKQSDVKALSKTMEAKKWELLFLGANFDKVGDVAVNNFGVSAGKYADVKVGTMHDYMTTTLSSSTRAYAHAGTPVNLVDNNIDLEKFKIKSTN